MTRSERRCGERGALLSNVLVAFGPGESGAPWVSGTSWQLKKKRLHQMWLSGKNSQSSWGGSDNVNTGS